MSVAGEKKSALLVGTFLSSSGRVPGVGEDLARRLADSGWRVITTSSATTRRARLVDMVTTAWRRREEYTVAQVDVFSGPAFGWAEAVCWTLRQARKPYVLALRGGNLPAFARRWPGRVRRLLGSAAAVTTPSRFLLEQMAFYGSNMQVLPNPLDLAAYPFRPRDRVQPRLVWLRSFHAIYNPTLALQVLVQLAEDVPDAQLTMVGPDKGEGSFQQVQQELEGLNLSSKVALPGGVRKAEVPAWLNRGDIFLNTTDVDNTPVSVLEAMACGLCVVSTNVGGIPYLLEHEREALLVPPDDPAAMSRAVRRLLSEPGLAARLSRNARRKAEQFDWSMILPRWESILAKVTGHA